MMMMARQQATLTPRATKRAQRARRGAAGEGTAAAAVAEVAATGAVQAGLEVLEELPASTGGNNLGMAPKTSLGEADSGGEEAAAADNTAVAARGRPATTTMALRTGAMTRETLGTGHQTTA
jgi:hypothetical protein